MGIFKHGVIIYFVKQIHIIIYLIELFPIPIFCRFFQIFLILSQFCFQRLAQIFFLIILYLYTIVCLCEDVHTNMCMSTLILLSIFVIELFFVVVMNPCALWSAKIHNALLF